MNIAITGHRPSKLGNDYDLTSDLVQSIRERVLGVLIFNSTSADYKNGKCYKLNGVTCITGMALGIDTLFALLAIRYQIPFIAAIPCLNQDSKWTNKSSKLYQDIISDPLCTQYYVSKFPYTPYCMQNRNKWMVDNSDLLIAVWDGSSGGTANCVKYAKSKNKEIIIIHL